MDSGFFLATKLLAVPAAFALALTLLLCPFVLLLYRARVAALMREGAGAAWAEPAPAAAAEAPRWLVLDASTRAAGPLGAWQARARRARARLAGVYAGAGLAAGLALTAVFVQAYAAQRSASAVLAALIVFALPAVATVLHLLIVAALPRLLAFAGVLLLAWLAAGIGRELGRTIFEAFVLLPALLLFVFSLRLWRGVAPLLLPLATGASLLWVIGAQLGGAGGPALLWTLRLAGFALGAALGLAALQALQARLESARLGDEQLFIAAWWLVYVVCCTIVFALLKRQLAYLAVLLVFPLWLLARALLLALWPAPAQAPLSLLLLRVFDQGGRTERSFTQLERDWRGIGRITLIAGRDLALRSIGAADVVAFVTGRLRRRFVADAAALQRRLAAAPTQPDPDGRFPVEHYWCHADTWRPVMRALAARCDVVLMDLRGYDAQREGCAYELRHLAATARDKPVLLVVSEAREVEAVRALLGAQEAAGAPWRLLRVGAGRTDLAPVVFDALPAALEAPQGRGGRRRPESA